MQRLQVAQGPLPFQGPWSDDSIGSTDVQGGEPAAPEDHEAMMQMNMPPGHVPWPARCGMMRSNHLG